MKSGKQSPLGFYTIGIAALFLAGFFLLVLFGAINYRNTVAGQTENMKSRALLSYLSTVVKTYDEKDMVDIADSEYGQVLMISDGDSGYALRIYKYEDTLVEDYAVAEAELDPKNAQAIGETGQFVLARPYPGILSITTDAGDLRIHIRSEGGDLS